MERQKEERAPVLAGASFVAARGEDDPLMARVAELETQNSVRKELELDLKRQLAVKVEELELMHHRIIQIEQIGRVGSADGAFLPSLRLLFWNFIEAPQRLICSFFPRFLGSGNALRRVVGFGGWAFVTGVFFVAGGFLTDKNVESSPEWGSPGLGSLVETTPVLREIESANGHESRMEELAPPSDSNEKERLPLVAVATTAGSGDSLQVNLKEASQETAVPSTASPSQAKVETKATPPVEMAQTADAAAQLDSTAASVRKEPAPIGEVLVEGKETLKNLNRTPLPSQFLGTPFGTAIADVVNLANWTESSGRFRRKATLVGAPVEAVLIPDHDKRIMAGAYVRICPRSTESLAPFLEWAVGVQDAIDAEYGEPSSVHEVSEAEDAAGVVERIANGKDFYEAMWERQSDDGLIVLSIRAFNERSVVFRLEYLNRAMLAAYTEQQKEQTQPKSEDVLQRNEPAQNEQSKPVQN